MEFYGVIHPRYREKLRLVTAESSRHVDYPAFPSILRVDESTLLVSYKCGQSHMNDPAGEPVPIKQLLFNIPKQTVEANTTVFRNIGQVPQMGEYVRMPSGDICLYIDMQKTGIPVTRSGMEELRSHDGGRTYAHAGRVGVIDGVEYGYPLSACQKNGTVFMAAMTFGSLNGSNGHRAVHIISTLDSGKTWHFVCSLSKLLGHDFNESDIIAAENGFILVTRGEHCRHEMNTGTDRESPQCISILSDDFKLVKTRDYHVTRNDVTLFGRPRIYLYKGKIILATRQFAPTIEGERMVLDMFVVDPATLEINCRFRLDDPCMDKQDGHYPSLYIDRTGRQPMLRVVDYLTCPTPANPTIERRTEIVQLSFKLEELEKTFYTAVEAVND